MAARVGILALLHESNTFLSQPTTLELFEQATLVTGSAVRDQFAGTFHEVGGFFAGLEEQGLEAVPLFAARTMPYGAITAETMSELLRRIRQQLAEAGPLAGLLVAPHGATVSERELDADGYWLEEVRRQVGPAMPIIGTLDAHANLSPRMVAACNALIAYRSNPHLDQRERGIEAARLLARTLRGEVRPTMAAAFPPMAINIERQLTTEPHCVALYQQADAQLGQPGVLSNSVLLGFPYADVPEMGSSLIVVTDNDQARAQQLADELADWLWRQRHDFVGQLISISTALDHASTAPGPIGLLDMGDNVGGGSPGDSTFLAQALVDRRIPRSLVVIYDPQSVGRARAVGAGGRVSLAIGGHTDRQHGEPLVGEFEVLNLNDGEFTETQARHGGMARCQQGLTAVVRGDTDLTIILTSRRMPPFSLGQITSCGLDPTHFHLLVAKGVIAPVAAYAPICRELIRVNTPGVTTADMLSLPYQHRRRPMFPFEDR